MAKRRAKETKAKAAPATKRKGAKAAAEPVVTTAAKPEREVRNGVTRPREGGLCAAVWTALDQLHAAGVVPVSKDARDLASAKGWNENNALAELSGWRKFNGLVRQVKPKRKTVAKTAAAVITEAAAS